MKEFEIPKNMVKDEYGKSYIVEDGDFLTLKVASSGSFIDTYTVFLIYKKAEDENNIEYYADFYSNNNKATLPYSGQTWCYFNSRDVEISFSTPSEKLNLLNELHKIGKDWDEANKKVVDYVIFNDGDVCAVDDNFIFLVKKFKKAGEYYTYAVLGSDGFSVSGEEDYIATYQKIEKVNKEQRTRFFEAMHNAGKDWAATNKQIIDYRKFKDGDVVEQRGITGVVKSCEGNTITLLFRLDNQGFKSEVCDFHIYPFTIASKESRCKLFAAMSENGYSWNAKKKEFKKVEWKPRNGDEYFVPRIDFSDFYISQCWNNDERDNWRLKNNMVFKTKEEAVDCAKQILGI